MIKRKIMRKKKKMKRWRIKMDLIFKDFVNFIESVTMADVMNKITVNVMEIFQEIIQEIIVN
jgi:hypothetical protein